VQKKKKFPRAFLPELVIFEWIFGGYISVEYFEWLLSGELRLDIYAEVVCVRVSGCTSGWATTSSNVNLEITSWIAEPRSCGERAEIASYILEARLVHRM
jgi:hypothetical protein